MTILLPPFLLVQNGYTGYASMRASRADGPINMARDVCERLVDGKTGCRKGNLALPAQSVQKRNEDCFEFRALETFHLLRVVVSKKLDKSVD